MNNITDIVIIVPKHDELYWLGLALSYEFVEPDRYLPYGSKPIYDRILRDSSGNDMQIAFVAMDAQGNAESALITRESVHFLDPSLAFLIGTGLGNPRRCKVGDVVFSEKITDVSETKAFHAGSQSWRSRHFEPTGRMRRDAGRFRESLDLHSLQEQFHSFASDHLAEHLAGLSRLPAGVHLEAVAAGDVLIASASLTEQLWSYDDRLACYDMESGGFARALGSHTSNGSGGSRSGSAPRPENGRQRNPDWMIVRGISDFGDETSKANSATRHMASAVAGIVLREFLESGLKECHPFQLRPPTESATEIPSTHFYVSKSGTRYFRERIEADLGVELPADQPSRHRTINALAALLYPLTGQTRDDLIVYLTGLRSEYFTEKYLEYSYAKDLRSLLPGWALEFREIVRGELNMPRSGLDVLDVGVGNGLELEPLFGDSGVLAASVIGVDVSEMMLAAAKARFPQLSTVNTSAEALDGIGSRSIDLYVSLRTYMSRLFDVTRALEEAVRVLRPSGGIVLSIANGYVVDDESRSRQLVRGLTVSGGEAVDTEEPHSIGFRIRRQLWDCGFEAVGYHSSATDVYIWGRAPRARGGNGAQLEEMLSQSLSRAKRSGAQQPSTPG